MNRRIFADVHRAGAARIWEWGARSIDGWRLQLAHSLLAAGTLLTLVANPVSTLLHFPGGGLPPEYCAGVLGLGAFCLFPDSGELVRVVLAIFCVPLLAGIVPPVSGLFRLYSAFTLASNTNGVEGGDQLAVNLGAMLTLISVLQCRWWGWSRRAPSASESLAGVAVTVSPLAARLQIAFVYFEAAVVKLGNPLWSDGTALWYWPLNSGLGAAPPVTAVLQEILQYPSASAVATWGTMALELFLCGAILFAGVRNPRTRRAAFLISIAFHLVIALLMGLVTFGIVMSAALTVALTRSSVGRTGDAGSRDDAVGQAGSARDTKSIHPLENEIAVR